MIGLSMPEAPLDGRRERDRLWDHCRNSLGIARLLVNEGRPQALVATACHLALESACRAAISQCGFLYDGSVERSLTKLAAPPEVLAAPTGESSLARLKSTEQAIEWLAAFLRGEAPERTWGY